MIHRHGRPIVLGFEEVDGGLSRRPFPLPVLDHLRTGAVVRVAQVLALALFHVAIVHHPVALVHRALLSVQATLPAASRRYGFGCMAVKAGERRAAERALRAM